MKRKLTVALFVLSLCAPGFANQKDPNQLFEAIVERYFTGWFEADPAHATVVGLHEYDSKMWDCSKKAVDLRVVELSATLGELGKIPSKRLTPVNFLDWKLLMAEIEAELLDLTEIRYWEKDPDYYPYRVNQAIYVLIKRNYAPLAQRLKAIISREKKAINAFQCARDNLKNPPLIYTQTALEQMASIIRFFEKDVPLAVKGVSRRALLKEFETVNRSLIKTMKSYQSYLKDQVLPVSNGDFRIGEANFKKKLKFEEMIETPLPDLLRLGEENLKENQEAFKKVALQIDPKKTPAEVMADLEKEHPTADKLLQAVRNTLGGLRQFIVEKDIITLPSDKDPIVQETPPFKRAMTFASMNTPGPFETKSREAYYNVTLPDPSWTEQQVEEHLRAYNYGTLVSTSIHEALPGHYTQFMWSNAAPSKVRKLLSAKSNREGWAHYTEQMLLDEGYGKGDLKLRLGQLQDALLRNARFIVGIKMHTGQMTYDEGVDFFMKQGYQARTNAEREARRGTYDATYLVYTLGKLQILKLREDYAKKKGPAFSLKEFHDEFMRQGSPPIALVREAMLQDSLP
jgi:uncharacterized protein (DUF885 family)